MFFTKIKHFRHMFSRFDKLANRFLGFLHLAGTLIWLWCNINRTQSSSHLLTEAPMTLAFFTPKLALSLMYLGKETA